MNNIEKTHIYIACAVFLLSLLIWFFLHKRKQRRLEMKRNIDDKLREEALDKVLVGGANRQKPEKGSPVPYDVRYDLDNRKKKERRSQENAHSAAMMIQLTEISELSTRRYIFNLANKISFGSYTQNDIVINASQIAGRQCEIFSVGRKLYVKNLAAQNQIILKRKRKQVAVAQDALVIQSGDVLVLGNYAYEIIILN